MLETERLILKPLSYLQLLKYIKADDSLEKELNLFSSTRIISPELKEALEQTILPNVANPSSNYLYSTLWTVISKSDNKMVGDLCFVGEPNANGEVEIGYGTYEDFRGNGYMTDAVGAMIGWAKHQPEVKAILASTDKTNVASYSVLQKNQFTKAGESDELFHWRLQL
jgi:[ribosomal protein S5]-alanine N-acetyltransferase